MGDRVVDADDRGARLDVEAASVSPQPAYPRTAASHDVAAAGVLERHARAWNWCRCLPIPIETIAQQTLGLQVVWGDVSETRNECILAVLHPKAGVIEFNERHRAVLRRAIGPGRFILAHEIGHLLYDADRDGALFDHPAFCRNTPDDVREVNASRLATALLLPSDLVRAELSRTRSSRPRTVEELNSLARTWGVSRQTLDSRLGQLGLGWCIATG